jgi:hypothetical protein
MLVVGFCGAGLHNASLLDAASSTVCQRSASFSVLSKSPVPAALRLGFRPAARIDTKQVPLLRALHFS